MSEAVAIPLPLVERKAILERLADPLFLGRLCKRDLERLRRACCKQINTYKKPRRPKYGNLNRGFSDAELAVFFAHCACKRARVMFLVMLYLGLRIGEVCRIRVSDLDFVNHYLYLETEKAGTQDMLYLHDAVYDVFVSYFAEHRLELQSHEYVFYGCRDGHASPNWLCNQFRETMAKCHLHIAYGMSDDQGLRKRPRCLNRLTSHSFRHTFITGLSRVAPPLVVKRLARHQRFSSTEVYIRVSQDDCDAAMMQLYNGVESEKKIGGIKVFTVP